MEKYYQIQVEIKQAYGHQTYEVVASSEEEALERFRHGGGEFIEEEIDVQKLGEPRIVDCSDKEHVKDA